MTKNMNSSEKPSSPTATTTATTSEQDQAWRAYEQMQQQARNDRLAGAVRSTFYTSVVFGLALSWALFLGGAGVTALCGFLGVSGLLELVIALLVGGAIGYVFTGLGNRYIIKPIANKYKEK